MLSTDQARTAVLAALPELADEQLPLGEACGRVLRQTIEAERDQPPFDRVTMDGIAIRSGAVLSGRRRFAVAATQHAGDPRLELPDDRHCIEVMTGAVLPAGSDCVVPVERIASDGGRATLEEGYEPAAGQFVHARGSDHGRGHVLLTAGQRITPLDVALIASAGCAEVRVARRPVTRIISTGNELVPPGAPVAAHQIRLSNGPALAAMLSAQQFTAEDVHLPDDRDVLQTELARHLDEADALVLSGGVSMGKADFVPQVLEDLGVRRIFHRIAQRPGKPMWFGTGPRGQAVYALPGNPVSSLVCCRQYVLPALLAASGTAPTPAAAAVLAEGWEFPPDLTCFLPCRLLPDAGGRRLAMPVPTNTSGDFTALSGTDGYLELDRRQQQFAAGSVQPLHFWARP